MDRLMLKSVKLTDHRKPFCRPYQATVSMVALTGGLLSNILFIIVSRTEPKIPKGYKRYIQQNPWKLAMELFFPLISSSLPRMYCVQYLY